MVGAAEQHRLAVELEHQPQHAVRAGVLRPHVDGHRFGADLRHRTVSPRGQRNEDRRRFSVSSVSCASRQTLSPPGRRSRAAASGALPARAAVDVRRHVDVNRRPPRPTAPPSRPVSAIVCSPARARRLAAPPRTFGDRAAGGDAERDVARPAERLDLPREHALERVVVADARQHARVGRQRHRRQRRALARETVRRARRRRAAHRPRCRRCRTAAACRRRRARRRSPPPRRAPAADRRCLDALVQRDRLVERRRRSSGRALTVIRASADPSSTLARNSSSVTCSGSRRPRRHPDLHRVVLAQRIALPVLRHQQPPRIRDGRRTRCRTDPTPRARASWPPARRRSPSATCAIVAAQPHLQPQPQPVRDRHQDVDELEARLARPEIDRGQLGEQVERAARAGRAARARPPARRRATRRSSSADRRSARSRSARRARLPAAMRRAWSASIYESFCWSIFRWSWTMP